MKLPVGHARTIGYDAPGVTVDEGDYLRTPTGRTYLITKVRMQQRGEHAGRKHLRAVVVDSVDVAEDATVHPIYWYRREKAKARKSRAILPPM